MGTLALHGSLASLCFANTLNRFNMPKSVKIEIIYNICYSLNLIFQKSLENQYN